jgi:hypothetical protein
MAKSLLAASKTYKVSVTVIIQTLQRLGLEIHEHVDHKTKLSDEMWLALKKELAPETETQTGPGIPTSEDSVPKNNSDREKKYKGKIIAFDGWRGMIFCLTRNRKIPFFRTEVESPNVSGLKRGDVVSFVPRPNPTRPGYFIATHVHFLSFDPPTLARLRIQHYDPNELHVGVLLDWNGRFGHIKSPLLEEKDTFLYYTRYLSANATPGDTLVYLPIESRDPRSTYFAYFAQPITQTSEEDLFIILKSDRTKPYPPLIKYLKEKYPSKYLLWEITIESEDHQYQRLLELVQKYESDFGLLPTEFLHAIPVSAQLYLWEKGIRSPIDRSIINSYFQSAPYREKKRILDTVDDENTKKEMISSFISWFIETKQFYKINQELKPALKLIKNYIQTDQSDNNLYDQIFLSIQKNLPPERLLELWLSGHIDNLIYADFVVEYLNFREEEQVSALISRLEADKEEDFSRDILEKGVEKILLGLAGDSFDAYLPSAVSLFKYLEQEENKIFFDIVAPRLKSDLTPDLLFILKAYSVRIDEDTRRLLKECTDDLNIVYLILENSNEQSILGEKDFIDFSISLSVFEKIKADLITFPWNSILGPHNFLNEHFQHWKYKDIFCPAENIKDTLAIWIFEGLTPKYTVHHLRLLLAFPEVLKGRLDYFGFAQPFRNLTNAEKRAIRDAFNEKIEKEFEFQERSEILKCNDYIEFDDYIEYQATVENIYFDDGVLSLRLPSGEYTEEYMGAPVVTAGLNSIPPSSSIAKTPLKVRVKDTKIIDIDGVDKLMNEIYKNNVIHILSKTKREGEVKEGVIDYALDLDLKKQIINYLDHHQIESEKPISVHEYSGNYFGRRKKYTSGDDIRHHVANLYSIAIDAEKTAIIWECTEFYEGKGTFIFITSKGRHTIQLGRIKLAVSSYKNSRSYLASKFGSAKDGINHEKRKMQLDMRNYLGYAGNIRKGRGRKDAFNRWLNNFINITTQTDIPPINDEFDPDVVSWDNFGLVIIKGKKAQAGEKKRRPRVATVITNNGEVSFEPGPDKEPRKMPKPSISAPNESNKAILTLLDTLNQNFLKGLNL